MKLRFTIIAEMEVKLEEYPGAKNIEDIVKMQQKYMDIGIVSIRDILGDNFNIKVTAIKES